jgi:hypothetical protein
MPEVIHIKLLRSFVGKNKLEKIIGVLWADVTVFKFLLNHI